MNFKSYLQKNARKIDLYLYEYLFEGGKTQPVLEALAAYQNADGGFGKALEPDVRLPDSSAYATTIALQYLTRVGADSKNQLVAKAIKYLLDTYDSTRNGWILLPQAADNFPRAPWWGYEGAKNSTDWGNPSAEVLGYLLKYSDLVSNKDLLAKLSERAVQRLQEIAEPEQHEVKCFIRLYEMADGDLQKQLHDNLAKLITKAAATDPSQWEGYAATPLTFVNSPKSPFADLFDKSVLLENAKFIQSKVVDGDHWFPAWEWGAYPEDWAKAKVEWSGKLTVENLEILKAFSLAEAF